MKGDLTLDNLPGLMIWISAWGSGSGRVNGSGVPMITSNVGVAGSPGIGVIVGVIVIVGEEVNAAGSGVGGVTRP